MKRIIAKNEYIFMEDYLIIKCILGETITDVIVDKEDYDKVKNFIWRIHKTKGYPIATMIKYVDGKRVATSIFLHKLIMDSEGYNPKSQVDHFDKNKLNNRKSNLRFVSGSRNNLNRTRMKTNTSGRTGVRYKKNYKEGHSDSWVGFYEINGKKISKYYSINKYGNDKAYSLALKFREEAELKYNITTEK